MKKIALISGMIILTMAVFVSVNINNADARSVMLSGIEALTQCEESMTCSDGSTISCSAPASDATCKSGIISSDPYGGYVECFSTGRYEYSKCTINIPGNGK